MNRLLENIKNFAEEVMHVLHGLLQIKVFRYFLILLISLIACTILYAVKFKGMALESFGIDTVNVENISVSELTNHIIYKDRSALSAHNDTQEIIKRFYEKHGTVPFGYTV